MIPLLERAENYDLPGLEHAGLANELALNFPLEYLLSNEPWARTPLYYCGPKGSGKTFVWRNALNRSVERDRRFLPLMYTFKSASKLEILDPLKIARQDIWGERLGEYGPESLDKLKEKASVHVYDDIQYMFEAVRMGHIRKKDFIGFLKDCLRQIDEGKKVVFISEDIMSLYAEYIGMKEFDNLLPRFGMFSPERVLDRKYIDPGRINYMALREIPDMGFQQWSDLFTTHNVKADYEVVRFIYYINRKPRSFVRFVNRFCLDGKPMTISRLMDESMEILQSKIGGTISGRKKLKSYEVLFKYPVIEDEEDFEGIRLRMDARRDVESYYTRLGYSGPWYLLRPVDVALRDILDEEPTLEILARSKHLLDGQNLQ